MRAGERDVIVPGMASSREREIREQDAPRAQVHAEDPAFALIETVKRVAELSWTPMAGGKHLSACRPNRATYQMVWYYLIGLASLKELEAFIRSPR